MSSTTSDLHVKALYYHLEIGEGMQFDAPPPEIWDTDIATLELRDGRLKCAMKQHFADLREARKLSSR